MRDRHLRQRPPEQQGQTGNDDVRQDHRRTGDVHRQAAGEEQAGADRAAERHHRLLRGGELPLQAMFGEGVRGRVRLPGHAQVTTERWGAFTS